MPPGRKPARKRFIGDNFSNTIFHNVDMSNARIRGAFLMNAEFDGWITGLKINGVDVEPLVRAERHRLYPELKKMKVDTPKDMQKSWAIIEGLWKPTMTRALKLAEKTLRASVDEEWSFIDSLRHLICVTDAWVRRTVLREQGHYYRGGLMNSDAPPWFARACGLDQDKQPPLAEVLAARKERMKVMRDLMASLTPAQLDAKCKRNPVGGYPADPSKYTVRRCLATVLNEEWEHHRFVVRDLDLLKEHPELASHKRPKTTTPRKLAAKKK